MKKWPIFILPTAELDLVQAIEWYEVQSEALARDFEREVDKAIKNLETFPESYPIYYKSFRRVMTRRFPYKLFYHIEENRIVVFRVLHSVREHIRHLPL